jgi:hypothetical protein
MKKLMKAIAFATVMCMLLSTAAFAHTVVLDENADRTINITVTGAEEGEQVALVVVKAGTEIEQGNILYINQTEAGASGAAFVAPIAAEGGDVVDIYAGSVALAAANNNSKAVVWEDFSLASEVENITISLDGEAVIVENAIEGADIHVGAAVARAFKVTLPTVNLVNKVEMIWSIRYTNDQGVTTLRRFTPVADITDIMSVIEEGTETSVKLGVAFINGTQDADAADYVAPVDITDAQAVFRFTRADKTTSEWASDNTDITDYKEN